MRMYTGYGLMRIPLSEISKPSGVEQPAV